MIIVVGINIIIIIIIVAAIASALEVVAKGLLYHPDDALARGDALGPAF
jgi:hypothetical protein